jgi:hypothetical protein
VQAAAGLQWLLLFVASEMVDQVSSSDGNQALLEKWAFVCGM